MAWVALIATIAHGCIAVTHGGPVAVPDVSAYLSVAQWIHGGNLPDQLAFYPGYGLLLAPLGWLSGPDLHTSALVLNALGAGICVILASALAGRLGLSQSMVRVVAIIAAIHPSLSASSRVAWPETLLVASVLGLALLVENDRWVFAGALAGVVLSLHPRVLVIVIALLVVAACRQRICRLSMGLIPFSFVTAMLLSWTDSWPVERITAPQNSLLGPGFIPTLAGQWLALSAGTAGLAALGLLWGTLSLRQSNMDAGAFIAISAISMMIVGAWSLAGSERTDILLYGRYIGPWAVPLTIVGLVAVTQRKITRNVVMVATGSIFAALVIGVSSRAQISVPARRIMTLDLGAIWAVCGDRYVVVAAVAAVVAAIGVVAARKGVIVPLALISFLAVSGSVLNHIHLRDVGQIADGQASTAQFVPLDAACLSHDKSTKGYALWLYRLNLPQVEHRRVDLEVDQQPCGEYVIATADALSECGNLELIAGEPRAKWALWRYPTKGCG